MNHNHNVSINRSGWTRIAIGALGLAVIAGLGLWLIPRISGQSGGLALLVLFALPMLLGHGLHGHGGAHHSRRENDPSSADPHTGHGLRPASPLRGTIDVPASQAEDISEPTSAGDLVGATDHAKHGQTGEKSAPHRHGGC